MINTATNNFLKLSMLLFFSLAFLSSSRAESYGYNSSNGMVPDKELAVNIGELVLKSIYGNSEIDNEKPLNAKLMNNIWVIRGTLRPHLKGGVAEIQISKTDGSIISVSHGK